MLAGVEVEDFDQPIVPAHNEPAPLRADRQTPHVRRAFPLSFGRARVVVLRARKVPDVNPPIPASADESATIWREGDAVNLRGGALESVRLVSRLHVVDPDRAETTD